MARWLEELEGGISLLTHDLFIWLVWDSSQYYSLIAVRILTGWLFLQSKGLRDSCRSYKAFDNKALEVIWMGAIRSEKAVK